MRIKGFNLVAILVATLAVYAVGFVLFGLIIGDQYLEIAGITKEQAEAVGASRMPFSPVPPLVTAIGMAILFRWGNVTGLASGVKWGALVALLSACPAIWYGWVYGVGSTAEPLLDSVHLLLGHMAAGAVLGAMK